MRTVLLFGIFLFVFQLGKTQTMTNKKMELVLKSTVDSITGELGYWEMKYKGISLMVITDQRHNRMRIISPIAQVSEITDAQIKRAMEANFHTALDARYAISNGVLWSAYIHPLKELSKDQLKDAVGQVVLCALTFGTTYSSTNLSFGGH